MTAENDVIKHIATLATKHKINEHFQIPIHYHDKKRTLDDSLLTDLELIEPTNEDDVSIYNHIFSPSSIASTEIVKQIAKTYTPDTTFLKQTQKFIKSIKSTDINNIHERHGNYEYSDMDKMIETWEEITEDSGFCEKYLYIDWEFGKMLNNNPLFLQLMGLYNIISPIMSLCIPIIVLIMPFFIIKFSGTTLSINEYINILKNIISTHAITRMFTDFNNVDPGQKVYILLSAAFYVFSIYQNILICLRFYANMKKIHNYLHEFKTYIPRTIEKMKYYHNKAVQLSHYTEFAHALNEKIETLEQFMIPLNKILIIPNYTPSFSTITNLGQIMHTFYQIYDNTEFKHAMLYSFGFNGYDNILFNINANIKNKEFHKTKYTKKGKSELTNMYYPKFINTSNRIENNCNLSKNIIITGPNASGKTTILKTAMINAILSQQIGYGCFRSFKLTPYDFFHSYLNIPDTSGRDSLFQAEARRCKDIIESVDDVNNANKSHFCIFDELFSGTNPDEAIKSAGAFMEYISKKNNVSCLLTTHYIEVCEKFVKSDTIVNYHMDTNKNDNEEFQYTYKLKSGISTLKGGVAILKNMNYPAEILDNA